MIRIDRKVRRVVRTRRVERELVRRYLRNRRVLAAYQKEARASGLLEHLRACAAEFRRSVDTSRYTAGAIGLSDALHLYAVVRVLHPAAAVETGVCNGHSTAFILLALERNGSGELYSIDLPETAGETYEPRTFWVGKGPAAIPPGREPGWVIPEPLRERWHLVIGRSVEMLPPLLERLAAIDFFLHDSEHSYECMRFELERAWAVLRPGGLLAADDVNATPAFHELAGELAREPVPLGAGMAFLVK